jgi:hypothetical protein
MDEQTDDDAAARRAACCRVRRHPRRFGLGRVAIAAGPSDARSRTCSPAIRSLSGSSIGFGHSLLDLLEVAEAPAHRDDDDLGEEMASFEGFCCNLEFFDERGLDEMQPSGGEHGVPDLRCRPATNAQSTERKLILANPVQQLDAGNRDHRMSEALQSQHRPQTPFHSAVILLDDILEELWQTIARKSTEDEVSERRRFRGRAGGGAFGGRGAGARRGSILRPTSTLEDIVRLMDALFYRLESEVDTLRTEIRAGIERLARLEGKVDAGFERIELRLGDIETRVEGVKHRVTALEARP